VDVVHETEDLGYDFASKFVHLKWECLKYGVSLDIDQHPFPKPEIYRHLKGDLTLKQICANMMTKKRNRLKKLGNQETFCSLPFKEYESMTPTQKIISSRGKPGATSIPIINTKNTKSHHDMTQHQ
jgi:hypothetical protein